MKMARRQEVPMNRAFLKVFLLLGVLIVCFWFLTLFPDLVIALVVSTLLSFILRPFVKALEFKVGLRRSLSVLIVFLIFGGAIGYGGFQLVPLLLDTFQGIYNQLKTFPFDEKLMEASRNIASSFSFLNADDIAMKVKGIVNNVEAGMGDAIGTLISTLITLTIVPFITFFILAEGDKGFKNLIERVPNKYFEMILNVIYKIQIELVGYLRGWLLDSFIIGIITIVALYFLGMPYAIILGTIAGVSNLIPYVGPFIGFIPSFIISLTHWGDFSMLLPLAAMTFTIQLIDNMLVQPICFSKSVDMHPITVIIVCLIGGTLMGVAGMLVAIPIFTILKVSAFETYWGLRNFRITA
jgi:predicted PurR-regulated permease PerM